MALEGPQQSNQPEGSVPTPEELGDGRVSNSETSLLWRCARNVVNKGHPAGETLLVEIPIDDRTFPLLAMTLTGADRLVCWGVLPAELRSSAEAGHVRLTDHVTIELSNRSVHVTSYSDSDTGQHDSRGWRMISHPENDVSFAFSFATRIATIRNQVLENHLWFRWPTSDAPRRIGEYRSFYDRMMRRRLTIATDRQLESDWVIGHVFLVDGSDPRVSPDILPPLKEWADEFVEGWSDEERYPMIPKILRVGTAQLVVCVGLPPGRLHEEAYMFSVPNGGQIGLARHDDGAADRRSSGSIVGSN